MPQTPLLSICIPTYNRVGWLQKCLDACLPQVEALPEGLVEVVVSDNTSEDATPELLAQYQARHPHLRLNRNPVNTWCGNFDTVLECASGRYAWLMGDDDAPLPGAIAHVVSLIQSEPRDFYLAHVVVDSDDPAVGRMEWFDDLPRLDWDLSDPGEVLEYMGHGRNASAVFAFISVLIFLRVPWLEAVAARPERFNNHPWPQVVTAMLYLKKHGRLRVIPESLVNYHCSTGSYGEEPWARAMVDLRGLIQVAEDLFPQSPAHFLAFLTNLRKNHGDGWISHHRMTAPDKASWEESKMLFLRAGYDPLKVAAVDLGGELLAQRASAPRGLDPEKLVVADLGFMARGARRILVMAGGDLATLRAQTLAEILVLSAEGAPMPVLPPGPGIAHLTLDLGKFSADLAFQKETCDTLQTFAPDLLINGDPGRHPAWDLMAEAAGAMVAVAWQAPVRDLDSQVAQWLDRSYTRILPKGAPLLPALGLDPVPESVIYEGPMKLNLGCGLDHMPGWVNVDKFPASSPDVVHDLECFPWPFADGAAEEVLLKHVMEHLGRDSDTFLGIMKELYRVCAPGAQVRIVVPHPRHQDFLQDPTHVRPVLPETFQHFSLAVNDVWGRLGLPGTPLAKYLSLDFEGVSTTLQLDPLWEQAFREGRVTREGLDEAMRERNNVVQSTEILLRAVKPFGGKVPVRWEGAFFTYHSLAHVNRQLCLEIQRGGQVDLSILPTESVSFGVAESPYAALGGAVHFPLVKAAVHVRHQWPPVFDPPVQGAWVMIQPWEFGGIPSEWVEPMRDQLDEIWVPSTWVRDCYVASGIPADRVLVVPNGVDTEVFRPEGGRYPLATGKSFKFLFLGGTILRKGIDLLLAAYLRAFRAADDVCLVIKGQGGEIYQGSELSGMLERIRQEDPQAPEIEYIVESIDEGRVADLYRACDVFVMPYRGEGFGLPIAEAMASGLPVIVTARGAADDFVKEEWAWLIPSERTSLKMVDGYHPSQAGFWLEEPDLAVLAGHLRHAFEHPGEGRTKGRNARAFATANLGWQGPAALVAERLRALASVRPRRESPPEKNQGSEAFLLTVDWSNPLWVEVLLSYVQAFTPGEPVALVLPWASQETSLEAAQAQVLGILQGAGWTTFPDVILVDRPGELPGILAKFTSVQDIAEGLQGAYGTRLDQARRLLAQN